jgi:hypothetical protein
VGLETGFYCVSGVDEKKGFGTPVRDNIPRSIVSSKIPENDEYLLVDCDKSRSSTLRNIV